MLKYPGFQHVTYAEAEAFATRIIRRMGHSTTDPAFKNAVAGVFHEMVRERLEEGDAPNGCAEAVI